MDTNSLGATSSSQAGVAGQLCLVADIGGTNARFALAAGDSGELLGRQTYATADFADSAELLQRALADFGRPVAACAIAVAGPVVAGRGALTNGTLEFSTPALEQQLGCPAVLLNDFYAVAASIDDHTAVLPVGAPTEPTSGVRAVVGPGTGLGMAYLVPGTKGASEHWQVMTSEGGNADLAPVDALELELLGILQQRFATVSIETLVSGRGLVNLYGALCELWGASAEHTSAAEITAAAQAMGDPVSDKCLDLFCAMLGTAAGNFALTVGAQGGVYLAGGVLPKIRETFLASEFRRRFDERGPLSSYNQQIPVWLVLDPEPGLTGAIREARLLLTTG